VFQRGVAPKEVEEFWTGKGRHLRRSAGKVERKEASLWKAQHEQGGIMRDILLPTQKRKAKGDHYITGAKKTGWGPPSKTPPRKKDLSWIKKRGS